MGPLLVDVYSGDVGGKPYWAGLAADAGYFGAVIKATEGLYYPTSSGFAWFAQNWPIVKSIGGERYCLSWFRGAYHFLKFNQDGAEQADFYLACVNRAGGWAKGDLWPIVDVELGNEKNSNQQASAQQIIDCTTAWADRVRGETGRDIMLYGSGAMRDKAITSRMGCDWLWLPRYTATLPKIIYERIGWTLDRVALWQYCGDGVGFLDGYPTEVPNFGRVDISTLLLSGGVEALRSKLWAEDPANV
jgi:GH25 family lysozyme M1 (1,4-beta-N-acetylmuramidase)